LKEHFWEKRVSPKHRHGIEWNGILQYNRHCDPHVFVALKDDKRQYMPVLVNFELLCALYF